MNAETKRGYEAIRDRALAAMPRQSLLRALQEAAQVAASKQLPRKVVSSGMVWYVWPTGRVERIPS